MYYSYVEIEYIAMSFSPARTDLALKLLSGPVVGGNDVGARTTWSILGFPDNRCWGGKFTIVLEVAYVG
jgi:hypothetical protein